MHIVLVEPEIPGNTGNIARLCAATGCHLHLVRPLGFSVEDKYLKRAGLDYWHLVDIHYYDSVYEVLENIRITPSISYDKGTQLLCRCAVCARQPADFRQGNCRPAGTLLHEYPESCIRIPMIEDARSLNLSNSVAIVAYEALRQNGFADLTLYGGEYK